MDWHAAGEAKTSTALVVSGRRWRVAGAGECQLPFLMNF
jgi:hypothetical protein